MVPTPMYWVDYEDENKLKSCQIFFEKQTQCTLMPSPDIRSEMECD